MAHSTAGGEPLDDRSLSPQKRPTAGTLSRMSPLQIPKAAPPPAPARDGTTGARDQQGSLRGEPPMAKQPTPARPPPASDPRPVSPRSGTSAATQFKPASIPSKPGPRSPSPQGRLTTSERNFPKMSLTDSGRSFGTIVKPSTSSPALKSSGVIGGVRGAPESRSQGSEDPIRGE